MSNIFLNVLFTCHFASKNCSLKAHKLHRCLIWFNWLIWFDCSSCRCLFIIIHYLDYLLTSDVFNELLETSGQEVLACSDGAPTAFYLDPGAG